MLQPVVDVELSALHKLDEAHERLCGLTERDNVGDIELRYGGVLDWSISSQQIHDRRCLLPLAP